MLTRSTRRTLPLIAMTSFIALSSAPAWGGVKLITLPDRERVEIQLDNTAATLIEEERVVPLAPGANDVVFKWTNVNIDKATIQLRVLTDPEEIKVLSVSYPPGETALTWQVASPKATSARVRISYVIGRLTKSFIYRAIADQDEKKLTLWQYIQLHNNANESFGEAGMWAGFGERLERPIGINETKRLLATRFDDVPIRKTYTADLARHGYHDAGKRQLRIPMHYVITNDERGGMGEFPLQPGKARIFQDDGHGTSAFLGEDWAGFTPRQEELALSLGVSRDIVVKRTIVERKKVRVMGNLYDYEITVKYEIENFKDDPVTLDIAESITALRSEIIGHTGRSVEWALRNGGTLEAADREKSTADRPVFHVELPSRGDDQKAEKIIRTLTITIKNEW